MYLPTWFLKNHFYLATIGGTIALQFIYDALKLGHCDECHCIIGSAIEFGKAFLFSIPKQNCERIT